MIELDPQNIPKHVAIIMDGNGRWAKAKGMDRVEGHKVGADSVRSVVRQARKIGIKYLTLYSFSEENWQRPAYEVKALMKLLNRYLKRELAELDEQGIRLKAVGSIDRLPRITRILLNRVMKKTEKNKELLLLLALSYGGRQEIIQACRSLVMDCLEGKLNPAQIAEEDLRCRLYTSDIPDPDLLIRTGGESRISNFLLWQIAYTEFFVTPTAWPDFRENELMAALADYQGRQRRFGRTGEQVILEKNGPKETRK